MTAVAQREILVQHRYKVIGLVPVNHRVCMFIFGPYVCV